MKLSRTSYMSCKWDVHRVGFVLFEEEGTVGKSYVSVHIWKLKTGKLGIQIKKAQSLCANISLNCLLTNSKYVNIYLTEKYVKRLSTVCIFKKPGVLLLGCRDSLAGLSLAEEVAPVLQLTGCYESRRCLIIIIYVPLPSCDNLNEGEFRGTHWSFKSHWNMEQLPS